MKVLQTCYFQHFENAWSCPSILIVSSCRKNQLVRNFNVYVHVKNQLYHSLLFQDIGMEYQRRHSVITFTFKGLVVGKVTSIYKNMQIRKGGGSRQCEPLPINYWKAYQDLQKERRIQKWKYRLQKLWLKVEKDQEQHKNTIIWIKRRAVKFHKSSITYWEKAILQPKNKQQPAAIAAIFWYL